LFFCDKYYSGFDVVADSLYLVCLIKIYGYKPRFFILAL